MKAAIIESYYSNEGKRLRKLVDSILVRFGGIYDKDKDDFYSIGNEVFVSAIRSYVDGKQSFDSYLRGCISNRVKTEITRRNAAKRSADIIPMTAINEDGEESEMDVASDFDLEEDILSGESAKEIYENLSSLGKKIVQLRLQGKSDVEIKSILNITQSDLANETKKMQTTTLRKITKTTTSKLPLKEKEKIVMPIGVSPDYRDEYYSVDELKYKVECGELLINHPNQRSDWAWSNDDISTLVATILHGFRINPVIVCEEVKDNGTVLNWVVDGKQRITSLFHFAFPNEYEKPIKITPKTEYTEIPYQVMVTDNNGNVVRDEVGRPLYETKIFDIKGKTFEDFPTQLKRNYLSYKLGATRYVNCDTNLISYHIRRYNKGKQMTKAQKANTYLGETTAAACKRVALHPLFGRLSKFTPTTFLNGEVEKTIMLSIMLMNYRDNWNSEMDNMFAFYEKNGDPSDFGLVEEYLTRINAVIDDATEKVLTPKDMHFFIAIFHEFAGLGFDDEEFNKFLDHYINDDLGKKVVLEDSSFDEIKKIRKDGRLDVDRSTMTPRYVTLKTEILHIHLNDYIFGSADDGGNSAPTTCDLQQEVADDLHTDCA